MSIIIGERFYLFILMSQFLLSMDMNKWGDKLGTLLINGAYVILRLYTKVYNAYKI